MVVIPRERIASSLGKHGALPLRCTPAVGFTTGQPPMTNLSIDLPDELAERLTTLSAETGRSAADMITEALAEYLGDLEDLAIARQRHAEFLASGERTYSLDEVERELGLDD
jgi:RHH-type rel operon transcriptional repressor/antitoxin RelB